MALCFIQRAGRFGTDPQRGISDPSKKNSKSQARKRPIWTTHRLICTRYVPGGPHFRNDLITFVLYIILVTKILSGILPVHTYIRTYVYTYDTICRWTTMNAINDAHTTYIQKTLHTIARYHWSKVNHYTERDYSVWPACFTIRLVSRWSVSKSDPRGKAGRSWRVKKLQ